MGVREALRRFGDTGVFRALREYGWERGNL